MPDKNETEGGGGGGGGGGSGPTLAEINQEDFGAPNPTTVTIEVNGASKTWRQAEQSVEGNGSSKNYIINIVGASNKKDGNVSASFGAVTDINVSIRSSGTLSLDTNGSLIILGDHQRVILRGPILEGRNPNNAPLIKVPSNAEFVLANPGQIRGNENNLTVVGGVYGGGVYTDGNFTMRDGMIYRNKSAKGGGGVYVNGTNANFVMLGGSIEQNEANNSGGGVYVANGGFVKSGGVVCGGGQGYSSSLPSANIADTNGSAVYYVFAGDAARYRNDTLGASKDINVSNSASVGQNSEPWTSAGPYTCP